MKFDGSDDLTQHVDRFVGCIVVIGRFDKPEQHQFFRGLERLVEIVRNEFPGVPFEVAPEDLATLADDRAPVIKVEIVPAYTGRVCKAYKTTIDKLPIVVGFTRAGGSVRVARGVASDQHEFNVQVNSILGALARALLRDPGLAAETRTALHAYATA